VRQQRIDEERAQAEEARLRREPQLEEMRPAIPGSATYTVNVKTLVSGLAGS